MITSGDDGRRVCASARYAVAVSLVLATCAAALAQVPIDPQTLAQLRAAYHDQQRQSEAAGVPRVERATYWGVAPLAGAPAAAPGGIDWPTTDFYVGLQPSPPANGYWTWGQFVWFIREFRDGNQWLQAGRTATSKLPFQAFSAICPARQTPVSTGATAVRGTNAGGGRDSDNSLRVKGLRRF